MFASTTLFLSCLAYAPPSIVPPPDSAALLASAAPAETVETSPAAVDAPVPGFRFPTIQVVAPLNNPPGGGCFGGTPAPVIPPPITYSLPFASRTTPVAPPAVNPATGMPPTGATVTNGPGAPVRAFAMGTFKILIGGVPVAIPIALVADIAPNCTFCVTNLFNVVLCPPISVQVLGLGPGVATGTLEFH